MTPQQREEYRWLYGVRQVVRRQKGYRLALDERLYRLLHEINPC